MKIAAALRKYCVVFLITFTVCLSAVTSLASISVNGQIFKEPTSNSNVFRYTILDLQNGKFFKLVAGTDAAKKSLEKLNNGDIVKGTASLIQETYVIESIDFVGLQRLLGLWKTKSTIVNFVDFSTVQFHIPGMLNNYNYAISPTNMNDQWQVYFSDSSSVILGALTVSDQNATITLFDTETGNVTESLELKKIQNAQQLRNENIQHDR